MPDKSSATRASVDDELLDAARAAFLEFGIKRTSMGEIAQRAGISSATLYRKCHGKPELVQAVALRELTRFLETLDEGVDRDADGVEQVVQYCVAVVTAIQNHDLLQRLMHTDQETVLPLLTVDSEVFAHVGQAYIAEVLRDLQQRGKLPDFPVDLLAEVVVRLTVSLVYKPQSLLPIDDPDQTAAVLRAAVSTIERGLRAKR